MHRQTEHGFAEIICHGTIRNRALCSLKRSLQMHGFYIDRDEKTVRFDVVVSFDAKDRGAVYQKVCEKVQEAFPEYRLQVTMDTDFSEE